MTKKRMALLARTMRSEVADEIVAAGAGEPGPIIRASVNRSLEVHALEVNGKLLGIFGVRHLRDDNYAVWAITSTEVDAHPLTFWRCSKVILNDLRDRYPKMMNMVHSRYRSALNWLERLGFQIFPPEPFGPHGDHFCQAFIETKRLIHV